MAISPPTINYETLVREDENGFFVSGRVYQDPAIFADEMDRIFTRGWVFVGHESEVPQPGDYRARFIGRQLSSRHGCGTIRPLLIRRR